MHQPGVGMRPRLSMVAMRKRFGATVALAGVDLRVAAGEVHAIVGENGAGKSTLMKVLSGAIRPDGGTMHLDGRPFRPRDPLDARRAGVAMIYQELSLCDHLSVQENILLGMEPRRGGLLDRRVARRRAVEALTQLGHGHLDPATQVARLSIAERQLVEIARAVVSRCRVLVLDEPTSSLDRADVGRLFELVRRLRGHGLAILYVSHFLEEVKHVSDRFTVLRDGAVVAGGKTADTPVGRMVAAMVGRQVGVFFPRSRRHAGEVALEVERLAGRVGLQSAAFTLRRGQVLGIAGLVGSGRTRLLRTLFGLEPVRRGEIRVGAFAGSASPRRRWSQGIGLLSEDRKGEGLALGMTVADNLTLSRLDGIGPTGWVRRSRQDAAARRWIERLGIRCDGPRRRAVELSGGNQQKVALARLLHHDVDVLLLDEPTRGIDVGSKQQIYELIDRLAAGAEGRRPRAVLMVSSYVPDLLGACDFIAVMCRGRLGPMRPVASCDEQTLLLEATGHAVVA